jgi:predicted regulator of Ras-like GTPase activity (Roadblock/LC7/MglB family)
MRRPINEIHAELTQTNEVAAAVITSIDEALSVPTAHTAWSREKLAAISDLAALRASVESASQILVAQIETMRTARAEDVSAAAVWEHRAMMAVQQAWHVGAKHALLRHRYHLEQVDVQQAELAALEFELAEYRAILEAIDARS